MEQLRIKPPDIPSDVLWCCTVVREDGTEYHPSSDELRETTQVILESDDDWHYMDDGTVEPSRPRLGRCPRFGAPPSRYSTEWPWSENIRRSIAAGI